MPRAFRFTILTALAVVSVIGCSKDKEIQYVDRPVPVATPIPTPIDQSVRANVDRSDRLMMRGLFVKERGNTRHRKDLWYRVKLFAENPAQNGSQPQSVRFQTLARGAANVEFNKLWTFSGSASYSKWSFAVDVQGWKYLQAARHIGLGDQDPGYVQISFEDESGQVVDSSTFTLSEIVRTSLTPFEGRTETGVIFHTQAEMNKLTRVNTFKRMIAEHNDADLSKLALTAIAESDMLQFPISTMWASPRGGASGFTYFGADIELVPGRN